MHRRARGTPRSSRVLHLVRKVHPSLRSVRRRRRRVRDGGRHLKGRKVDLRPTIVRAAQLGGERRRRAKGAFGDGWFDDKGLHVMGSVRDQVLREYRGCGRWLRGRRRKGIDTRPIRAGGGHALRTRDATTSIVERGEHGVEFVLDGAVDASAHGWGGRRGQGNRGG